MKYETFKKTITQKLEYDIPNPKKIAIHPVMKNNGLQLDGLVIMENACNISPTLYLNYYYDSYQAGTSFQQVYETLLDNYRKNKPKQSVDVRFFTDFANAKPHIAFKLVNSAQNTDLLKRVPHIDFLDLSLVFYCMIPMDIKCGNATILIHDSHLDYWHITAAKLYDIAKENTPRLLPPSLHNIDEVLAELSEKQQNMPALPPQKDLYPMFVLSNRINLGGAACMLYDGLLKEYSAQAGTDFYILPSSIHEVILLPAVEENCMEELSAMVREVNRAHLSPEEILSDHAYYYSAKQDKILVTDSGAN